MSKHIRQTPDVLANRELLATNILHYASMAGMSRNALAQAAGVSKRHLLGVLHAKKGCTLDWLTNIATALGCAPGRLLAPDTAPEACGAGSGAV